MTEENEKLHEQLDSYVGTDGTLQTFDSLLDAARDYIENPQDIESVVSSLETIAEGTELTETSEAFQNLYQALVYAVGPEISEQYYDSGYQAYSNGDYETAIHDLTKAFFYDETNGDALYALGNAYRKDENSDQAAEIYKQVIELFPGTERARRAQGYLDDMTVVE